MIALNKKIDIFAANGKFIESLTLEDAHKLYVGRELTRKDYNGNTDAAMAQLWLKNCSGAIFIEKRTPKGKKLAFVRKHISSNESARREDIV